ncbi:MAG: S8 family serine peptidase [Egibacteraceae bacterium]
MRDSGSAVRSCQRWLALLVASQLLGLATLSLQPAAAVTDDDQARSTGAADAGTARLPAATAEDGSPRLIVGLRTAFTPEGRLGATAAAAQRGRIAGAQAALREELAGTGARVVAEFDTIPYVTVAAPPAALAALERSGGVASLTPDRLVGPMLDSTTPIVEADKSWARGYHGTGQTVAVLDTGVDRGHDFFSGRVVSEACYSANSNCPSGGTQQVGTGAAAPCTYAAGCEHGTHVAGTAAGFQPVQTTFLGVAPRAGIFAVQVFSRFQGQDICGGDAACALSYTSDQLKGLERVYALRNTFDVAAVNLSLGGGAFTDNCDGEVPAYKTMIDNLRAAGIATVIASGNAGYYDRIAFPSCISTAVSVGSTHDSDAVSWFSNSDTTIELLAPGEDVTSSVPGGAYASLSGTSMATPHVAGAWAVLKQAVPDASVTEVLAALTSSGKPVKDPLNEVIRPRIRISAALTKLGVVTPKVSVRNASIAEGHSGTRTLRVPVGLFPAVNRQVTVRYATSNGSATAGKDYTATSGRLTFSAGQSTKAVAVRVRGDRLDERNETLKVTLSSPSHATLGRRQATATIRDDDPPPALRAGDARVTEGNSGSKAMRFAVRLSRASAKTIRVDFRTVAGTARSPSDYAAKSGTLTFRPGQTRRKVAVSIKGDRRRERNEIFRLRLSSPRNAVLGRKNGTGTIVNDD